MILATLLMFGSMYLYPIAQIAALWLARPGERLVNALPLLLMVPVYLWTVYAVWMNSNLAGLFVVLASPLALLYCVVTITIMLVLRRR
jgi:hypothetical protein